MNHREQRWKCYVCNKIRYKHWWCKLTVTSLHSSVYAPPPHTPRSSCSTVLAAGWSSWRKHGVYAAAATHHLQDYRRSGILNLKQPQMKNTFNGITSSLRASLCLGLSMGSSHTALSFIILCTAGSTAGTVHSWPIAQAETIDCSFTSASLAHACPYCAGLGAHSGEALQELFDLTHDTCPPALLSSNVIMIVRAGF